MERQVFSGRMNSLELSVNSSSFCSQASPFALGILCQSTISEIFCYCYYYYFIFISPSAAHTASELVMLPSSEPVRSVDQGLACVEDGSCVILLTHGLTWLRPAVSTSNTSVAPAFAAI